MKGITNKFSILLVFLMVLSFNVMAAEEYTAADTVSLIDPEVAACESETARNSFNMGIYHLPNEISYSEFHEGTGSLAVSVTNDNVSYAAFQPTAALIEGELYRFSVWYKDSRNTPTGKLQLRGRTGTAVYIISGKNDSAQKSILSGWNKYEIVFSATSEMASSAFAYFYLTSNSKDSRTMYFDDMVFEKVSQYNTLITSDISECEDSNYTAKNLNYYTFGGSNKTRAVTGLYKHSGEGSLAVTSNASDWLSLISFKPNESLIEGEIYYFSMWYYDVNNVAGNNQFEFVIRDKNSSSGYSAISQTLTSNGEWNKYGGYFTVPANYAGSNFGFLYLRANGFTGTIYCDDITLRKVNPEEFRYGSGLVEPDVSACESAYALSIVNKYGVGGLTKTIDTTDFHNGTGSVKVAVTNDNVSYIGFKPISALTEGKKYYFSVWYYDSRSTASGNIMLRGRSKSDSAIRMDATGKAIRVGAWSKFECIFEADNTLVNNLNYLYITSDSKEERTMYFDDIVLKEINEDEEYKSLVESEVAGCESDYAVNTFKKYAVGSHARTLDNGEYHSGTGSVKVSVPGDNVSYIGFKPTEDFIEGENYHFSVWYYDSRSAASGNLVLRGRNNSDKAIFMSETARPIEAGGWAKYECTFKATYELASDLKYIYVTSDSTDARYMYFDDIELTKVNPYTSMVDSYVAKCESDYALTQFNANKSSSFDITRTIDKTVHHSGTGSFKVPLEGGYKTYVGIKPTTDFIEGKTYYFSAWYYNPEDIDGIMYLRYAYPNGDAIGNWIVGTSVEDTDCGRSVSSGWSKYEYTFTATANMASSTFKYLYLTVSAESGTLYFDDITLRRVPDEETNFVSCNVENGDTVACDKTFVFSFDRELDETAVSQISFALNGTSRYDAEKTLSDDNKTLTVQLDNPLQKGTNYTLSLKNVFDCWNRKVNVPIIQFKTVGDLTFDYDIYSIADGQRVDFTGHLSEPIDVVVKAVNNTFERKSFVLCLAEYAGTRLVDVSVSDRISLSAGNSTEEALRLNGSNGDRIKLFVFDSVNNLNPIVPMINVFPYDYEDEASAGSARYLVDDILYAGAIGYDNIVRPSGWDVDVSGGSLAGSSEAYVILKDTDTTNPVSMEKVFSRKVDNNVTVETSFKLSSSTDNLTFTVGGGNSTAFKLTTQNSYVCYENAAGQNKLLGTFSANRYTGVKVAFDIVNKSAAVYINGSKCGDVSFKEDVDYLDRICFSTSNGNTMIAYIGFVQVYENYLINESFSTLPTDASPDGFIAEGNVGAFVESNTASNTDRYLKLTGNSSIKAVFSGKEDKLYGSYKFLIKDSMGGVNVSVGDGITLNASGGKFYLNGTDSYSYRDNIWYQADYELDLKEQTAKVKLNGKTLTDDLSIAEGSDFGSLEFVSSGEVWIDDIMLFDKNNDYTVPAVKDVGENDYLVGMQTYFMWHEGTHYGWDRIAPFTERKPYLGWYTDGNPEVSDWEIKWMKEHGIDYEIFPWARKNTNKNAAIKRPIRSDALHDGYFNAKNSNDMKFALMWSMISTSTVGGSDDFRNNIVPYWLEYYFNDPRYLLIDNKPFLSIYGFENLVSVMGSEEAVKAEFDYLRQACIDAGFDGIYLILMTTETDTVSEFEKIANYGADAIYAYHWTYGSNTAKYQINSIENQIKNSPTDVIPYVSMGWNPQPWLGMPGEYCSLEDYETALTYVKNKLDTMKSSGEIDKKLAIVGNWNEYGEGHFMMPTGVAGFGYLDAVRKVFTTASEEHSDDRPTPEQIESMGNLYKQDRVVENVIPTPPDPSEYTQVIKEWTFNEYKFLGIVSDWSSSQITGLKQQGGVLKGTSTGIDPTIVLKDDINLDITGADYIKIRIKLTDSASGTTSIMFTTADNPEFGGGKYVSFCPRYDGFYDYYVYMKSDSRWNGTLKKIRIDPMESAGKFEIDSIQILKKAS